MINTLTRTALLVALAAAILAVTMPAFSQAPTDAQRSAVRSECRSDYEAHCASVPPGVAAVLAEKHVEPLLGLPDGGTSGGSTGCAESRVRAGRTQGRIDSSCYNSQGGRRDRGPQG